MKNKIITTVLICLLLTFAVGTSAFAQDPAGIEHPAGTLTDDTSAGNTLEVVPESLPIEEDAQNPPEIADEGGDADDEAAVSEPEEVESEDG